MRAYGQIRGSFWSRESTKVLSTQARLLLVYLYCSSHTTALGAFYAPLGYIRTDLEWDDPYLKSAVSELEDAQLVAWSDTGWVCIPRFLEDDVPQNDSVWKHVRKLAANLPGDLPFRKEVLAAMEECFAAQCGDGAHTVSRRSALPEPEPEPEPAPDSEPEPDSIYPSRASTDADLQVTADLRALAAAEGREVDRELKRFRDYCAANGKKYRNYEAAFRNWLRNPIGKENINAARPRTGTEALAADPDVIAEIERRRLAGDGGGDRPPDEDPATERPDGRDDRGWIEGSGDRTVPTFPGRTGGAPSNRAGLATWAEFPPPSAFIAGMEARNQKLPPMRKKQIGPDPDDWVMVPET